MAIRNIMEALNVTPDGSLPKNAYDLSAFEYLHSKMGQFLPVHCCETVPDATYRFSVDATTMTLPCNTASFSHMKENYYFLFVPYSQITSTAYSFFPNRKDNQSALDYGYSKMPHFPLGTVVARCIEFYDLARSGQAGDYKDMHGFGVYQGALRLLDLLGYGSYIDYAEKIWSRDENGDYVYDSTKRGIYITSIKNKLNAYNPNALRIAAYQKIWYCYFRNPQYDIDVSPRCFNFDDVTYSSDGSEPNYDIVTKRGIDNFIRECLQLRYVGYKKDIFTGSMPGTQWGAVSAINASANATLVGSTSFVNTEEGSDWSGATMVYGSLGSGNYQLSSTNFIRSGTADGGKLPINVNQDGSEDPTPFRENTSQSLRQSHRHDINGGFSVTNMKLFDVLQLVEAQAIQKWRQKSMLAGQRAINQYRAHYGIVPRHMQDHYPDFIGSVDNTIDISQVVSQANTATEADTSNLGDLGGRGYGSIRPKQFEYHASEHGILMLCRAIVPENLYSSYGLDRANELIYYTDFWQPELQNIGLEAVPKELLNSTASWNANPSGDASNYSTQGRVLGYAPRNYQLKQYPSKVHGMFNPSRIGNNFLVPTAFNGTFGFSDFQAFVQTRGDLVPHSAFNTDNINYAVLYMTIGKFYVNPSMANNTFAVDADSYEDTDQFIHSIRFNCEAVQPLSPLGLPMF